MQNEKKNVYNIDTSSNHILDFGDDFEPTSMTDDNDDDDDDDDNQASLNLPSNPHRGQVR